MEAVSVRSFIYYFEYVIYDNEPIGDECMNITNADFNDFRMEDYYNFRRLCEDELVITRPTLPDSSYKQNFPVNNFKRPIKCNPRPNKFYMMTPLCNYTTLITSVNTNNNKCIIPAYGIMINKDHERGEGLKNPGFLQVIYYFILKKGRVRILSLITLIIFY